MNPAALSRVVLVLDHPKDLVNIAGVVRVMMNFGIGQLRLVRPDEFDAYRIEGIAHRSMPLIEATTFHDTLEDAVADCTWVIGTTARPRTAGRNYARPREVATEIVAKAAEGNVAILFGREDKGLFNEGLDLCHTVAIIPTDPDYSSLNLAQACLVLAYEMFLADEGPADLPTGRRATRPPSAEELEQTFGALEGGLGAIEFFKARKPAAIMRTLRTLLARAEPDLRDAKLLAAVGFEMGHFVERLRSSDPSGPVSDALSGRSTVGDRYRVLLDIGRTLAGTLSLQALYAAIHHETARVLEASGFYVSLYDATRDLATIVYFADRGEIERVTITHRGSDSEVIRTHRAVLVADRLDDRTLMHLGVDDTEVTRSAISAPMIQKGRILGVISAQSYEPRAYTNEDLDLLQGIADIAAVAVDNAHHVAELERRRREAERVEEIGRALTSSLDASEVLGKVIAAVTDILNVDAALVWLIDGPAGRIGTVAASGGDVILPLGLSWEFTGDLADRLLDKQESVVVDDLDASGIVPANLREYLQTGSAMAVPVVVGGHLAGLVTAGSRKVRHFTQDDIAVLQRLASQVSIALENARLHGDVKKLSLTDPLTGLPNRRRLHIHLDKEVAAARRGRALVVVMFDFDDFKHYNDSLGHLAGDDILCAFAQILQDENRAMSLSVRYGGDEFISILPDADMEGAHLYIRRVTERVAQDATMSPLGVTVSVGLAEFDRTSMTTMDDIIYAADADMYRVKSQRTASQDVSSS